MSVDDAGGGKPSTNKNSDESSSFVKRANSCVAKGGSEIMVYEELFSGMTQ
jgi:hypothetical protein